MNEIIQNNLHYKKYVIDKNLQYFKPHSSKIEKTFGEEILSSLTQKSKFINPKFFYDKNGSELFEQICSLPEYYPTRIEIELLMNLKFNLLKYIDSTFRLVELGSGSSVKTRLILDIFNQFGDKIEYFPIDISEILAESSELLLRDYENLAITGIIDTYEGGLEFIEKYDNKKNLILFLGSSFGNFPPDNGKIFLKQINSIMKNEDLFLIGLDLVKDEDILQNAYNDSKGITAKFNLNVLSRINSELDANFVLDNFIHMAKYNKKEQRIEMYLKSLVNQSVIISKINLALKISRNEMILTEHSHKYTIPQVQKLMEMTGFEIQHFWTDKKKYYSLFLVSKSNL